MHESLQEVTSQYDHELADFQYDYIGVQVGLATHDCCSKSFPESLRQSASLILHLRLELDFTSIFGNFLMGVAQFVSETVGLNLTYIVEMLSSASDALELESLFIVKGSHYKK